MKYEIVDGDHVPFTNHHVVAPTIDGDKPDCTLIVHGGDKLAGFEEWWLEHPLNGLEGAKKIAQQAWLAARGGE